jgi:hypothetical protein
MHRGIYTHGSKLSTYGLLTTSLLRHSNYAPSKVTCSRYLPTQINAIIKVDSDIDQLKLNSRLRILKRSKLLV